MLTELQKRTSQAIVNIFETGSVLGDYSKVTLLPGDPGHLTYGRSQTTLASGNLHLLIKAYCEAPGAAFAIELRRYLKKLAARDTSLDNDRSFRALLVDSGADRVMLEVQDAFFDRVYWEPSVADGAATGIGTALGTTVVYDSHVHGGWRIVRTRTSLRHGPPESLGERTWIERYILERRDWLANHPKALLHATVYRMDSLRVLIENRSWELPLPLRVRRVTIDGETLFASIPMRASAATQDERSLFLSKPPMRGRIVESLQRALTSAGFPVKVDGVFGQRTDRAARAFQKARGLKADGIVGPATRASLGL